MIVFTQLRSGLAYNANQIWPRNLTHSWNALPNDDRLTFQGIGGAWHEIDPAMAAAIVRRVLEFDLAYGTREIDEQDALKICASFLHLFRPDARFFTNGLFSQHGWSGWGRVANATFETGVIAIDSRNIGILWCHDED